jgi:hypothetical protein
MKRKPINQAESESKLTPRPGFLVPGWFRVDGSWKTPENEHENPTSDETRLEKTIISLCKTRRSHKFLSPADFVEPIKLSHQGMAFPLVMSGKWDSCLNWLAAPVSTGPERAVVTAGTQTIPQPVGEVVRTEETDAWLKALRLIPENPNLSPMGQDWEAANLDFPDSTPPEPA